MPAPFADLRARPIPDQTAARAARTGFRHNIAIDTAHALYGEPLVNARELGLAGENFYFSYRNPPYWTRIEGSVPGLLVRKSVGDRLARVNARLQSEGLELFLFD